MAATWDSEGFGKWPVFECYHMSDFTTKCSTRQALNPCSFWCLKSGSLGRLPGSRYWQEIPPSLLEIDQFLSKDSIQITSRAREVWNGVDTQNQLVPLNGYRVCAHFPLESTDSKSSPKWHSQETYKKNIWLIQNDKSKDRRFAQIASEPQQKRSS